MDRFFSRDCMLQIIRTRMAFRQAITGILKDGYPDITFEMLQVLTCLWREQGISQQVLADRTVKDKASLTYLIANLEKKSMVCRREGDADRRNKLVFLTEKGEEFCRWVYPRMFGVYEELDRILGSEKLESLNEALSEYQKILERHA